MKFSASLLLASLAKAAASDSAPRELQSQPGSGTALAARWEMSEPTITYSATDVFTFSFGTASSDNYDAGMTTSFWDERCQDTLDGFNYELAANGAILNSGGTTTPAPALVMVAGVPTMDFKIDPTKMIELNPANRVVGPTEGANPPDIYKSPNPGASEIVFCVRNGLGYTTTPAMATSVFTTGYQEVNYIETLVIITYDLSAGFTVDGFNVTPKDRVGESRAEDYSDALEAYLCKGPQSPGYDSAVDATAVTYNGISYTIPKDITTTGYGQAEVGGTTGTNNAFNQGALINICVRVKDAPAQQGIRLDDILDFKFERADVQPVVGSALTQYAIEASNPSPNFLTSFTQCPNQVSCDFASVLFAQFYATTGTVSGQGNANLKFYNQRRLSEKKGSLRRLEEDAEGPGSSTVDLTVPVQGDAEGPGDLKTAAGASFGATAFASVVALVGAIVMA